MARVKKYFLPKNYKLNFCDLSIKLQLIIKAELSNFYMIKNTSFELTHNYINVYRGFSWDGASPKIKFLRWVIGTPDGKKNQMYIPTLIHDVLYINLKKQPFSRKTIDLIFLELMGKEKWKLRYIYYLIVRIFGGVYYELNK